MSLILEKLEKYCFEMFTEEQEVNTQSVLSR